MGYKQNLHTHSVYCDGNDTLEEMILAAVEQGFNSIGFSAHSYIEAIKGFSMDPVAAVQYKADLLRLKNRYREKIQIFCGLERDYNTRMDSTGYDYIIGSVHCMEVNGVPLFVDWDAEKLKHNVEDVFCGDGLAYAKHYYGEVAKIADSCSVDIIGHFDLVTKFSERTDYFDTLSEEYVKTAVNAIEALEGKVPYFEVNTGAMARGYRSAPYPADNLIGEFRKRGFGAIITTDCHSKELLSFGYDAAKEYLIRSGFTHHYILTENGFVPVSLFD